MEPTWWGNVLHWWLSIWRKDDEANATHQESSSVLLRQPVDYPGEKNGQLQKEDKK